MYETALLKKRPMRLSFVTLIVGRLDRYTFVPIGGQPMMRFFSQIHDLGMEQMQEDRTALASAPSIDVSESLSASVQGTGASGGLE